MNIVLQDINCKEHILEGQLLQKQTENIWFFVFCFLCSQKYS